MKLLVAGLVLSACSASTPDLGRYTIDRYQKGACDTPLTDATATAMAFELGTQSGELALRSCSTLSYCEPLGEAPILDSGPFHADGGDFVSVTGSWVPNGGDGSPNPPPPTTCTVSSTTVRLTPTSNGVRIRRELREDEVPIADCTEAKALALSTCAGIEVVEGHLAVPAPVIHQVTPASLATASCTSTPIALSGSHFVAGALVFAATTTTPCPDGSEPYRSTYDQASYCTIPTDAVTDTTITAHFTSCPPPGPTALLLINGSGNVDANGNPSAGGQITGFDGFAITP